MKKATVTPKGVLLSATANKYIDIIKSGKIENNELTALFTFLNNKATTDEFNEIGGLLWEHPLKLSADQNEKGIKWLRDQYKTPRSIERKNNPFGYREIAIIENFKEIELKGYYDAGNASFKYLVPLYECSGDNTSMEYYVSGGKIHIVG